MFRSLFRRSRTVRVPIDNANADIREVKLFRRPLSKPSNFITTFFVAYLVFGLVERATTGKDTSTEKSKWEEFKKKQGLGSDDKSQPKFGEHWKKAHAEITKSRPASASSTDDHRDPDLPPDVLHTTTIPIWFRRQKQRHYTPDDQEWKDYVTLQSDTDRVTKLKHRAAKSMVTSSNDPMIRGVLKSIEWDGKVDASMDVIPRIWVPPLYEVPAIILFTDGVGFGWKTLRPEIGTRMQSIFNPAASFSAATAACSVFFTTSWTIAAAKLSGQVPHQFPPSVPASKIPTALPSSTEPTKSENDSPNIQWVVNPESMQALLRTVHSGKTTRERHAELLSQMPFSLAVKRAAAKYRQKQAHNQFDWNYRNLRGVVMFRGDITFLGSFQNYKVEFQVLYLPGEDRFISPAVMTNSWMITDFASYDKKYPKASQKTISPTPATKPKSEPRPENHELPDAPTSGQKPQPGKEKE